MEPREKTLSSAAEGRREVLRAGLAYALATALPLHAQTRVDARSDTRADPQGALRLGVHPFNSTLALVATHRPLVAYLERTLQRPVEFYTSASFEAYIAALMSGEFDIAISPPHFALLAVERKHYVPVAHYTSFLEPFFVVRKDSPIKRAADVAGKTIAMADKTAFIRLVMIKQLSDAGLTAGKDYRIVERPTHAASIMAALEGEADLGLAMMTILRLQPPEVRQQLRPVMAGLKFPNLFTLAHQRLGVAQIAKLKQALQAFHSEPDGHDFLDKSGYGDYHEVTPEEIAALRPYVDMARPLLPAGL
jgi:phosphonate transport system substrate-binding protein